MEEEYTDKSEEYEEQRARESEGIEEKEIIITYESLFDILRREKNKEELQKLHHNFLKDVASYVNEKKKILEAKEEQETLFSSSEKEKTQAQLSNIKRIIRELYNRREKKIISMALNKSRTGSAIIDISALLTEEKEVFGKLVGLFDSYRDGVMLKLLEGNVPYLSDAKEKDFVDATKINRDHKTVRFVTAVPRFLGKELEQYGPFEEDDIANLPNEIAGVLIIKGRAEEIE